MVYKMSRDEFLIVVEETITKKKLKDLMIAIEEGFSIGEKLKAEYIELDDASYFLLDLIVNAGKNLSTVK